MSYRIVSSALVAFIAGAAALRADVHGDVRKQFTVGDRGTLVVKADSADLEVRSGNAGSASIEVIRVVRHSSDSKAQELLARYPVQITQEGSTIRVSVENRERGGIHFMWGNELDIRVIATIPRSFTTDLDTRGGDIAVTELDGNIDAHTSGGDMNFVHAAGVIHGNTSGGDIEISGNRGGIEVYTSGGDITIDNASNGAAARTSGGDITVRTLRGPMKLKTSGGNIELTDIDGGVDAFTNGGDLKAQFVRPLRGDVSLRSSGGNVRMVVPGGSAFDLDAQTSGGSVRSDLAVTINGRHSDDELIGRVGNGGPKVLLRSSSGDIYLGSGR